MQLLLLRSNDHAELKSYIQEGKYLSYYIINEIVSLMGMDLLKGILAEVKQAGIYSIIADEVTDVSNKEQLKVGQ